METETDKTKERTTKYRGKLETPMPHGKQTEKMKIKNRTPRITLISRLIGVVIIGTGGREITDGPDVRVGAKIRRIQLKGRVVSLTGNVKIRGSG